MSSIREQFGDYLDGYQFETTMDADGEPVSTYLRNTMLENLRSLDPSATLQSYANVRLLGECFAGGLFNAAAADIFSHLDQEVRAAAGDDADQVNLGFRQVQEGSVVLPLAVFSGKESGSQGEMVSAPSVAESAFLTVLRLHDELEVGNAPPSRFGHPPKDLIRRVRQLVESLDRSDACLEIILSQSNGVQRKSRLTQVGRERANRLFRDQKVETGEDIVCGNLASISIDGELSQVRIRSGNRKILISRVPAAEAKRLEWDAYLRIKVRTETRSDQFGDMRKVENTFIRVIAHEDHIPGTDG